MKKLLFVFLLLIQVLPACYAQVEDTEGRNSLFYYTGTLDKVDKIEFNLQVKGHLVTGSYILEDSEELYIFNGRMSADKTAFGVLVYYQGTDEYIGAIEASILSNENNFMKTIVGKFKNADGSKIRILNLDKVAEFSRNTEVEHTTTLGD